MNEDNPMINAVDSIWNQLISKGCKFENTSESGLGNFREDRPNGITSSASSVNDSKWSTISFSTSFCDGVNCWFSASNNGSKHATELLLDLPSPLLTVSGCAITWLAAMISVFEGCCQMVNQVAVKSL